MAIENLLEELVIGTGDKKEFHDELQYYVMLHRYSHHNPHDIKGVLLIAEQDLMNRYKINERTLVQNYFKFLDYKGD